MPNIEFSYKSILQPLNKERNIESIEIKEEIHISEKSHEHEPLKINELTQNIYSAKPEQIQIPLRSTSILEQSQETTNIPTPTATKPAKKLPKVVIIYLHNRILMDLKIQMANVLVK